MRTRNSKRRPPIAAEPAGWPHIPNFKFLGPDGRERREGRKEKKEEGGSGHGRMEVMIGEGRGWKERRRKGRE